MSDTHIQEAIYDALDGEGNYGEFSESRFAQALSDHYWRKDVPLETKVGNVTCVEHWGGEDEGSSYGSVYRVSPVREDQFIKVTGTYSSWDGIDWDSGSVKMVKPVEKTVIVYE